MSTGVKAIGQRGRHGERAVLNVERRVGIRHIAALQGDHRVDDAAGRLAGSYRSSAAVQLIVEFPWT